MHALTPDFTDASARRICADALEVLQAADEIGGPQHAEYMVLMRFIAMECTRRADTAAAGFVADLLHSTRLANHESGQLRGRMHAISLLCDGGDQ